MTADLISGFGLYSMKLCGLHFLNFEGVIVLGRAPINPCLIGPLVLCLERGFRPPFEGLQPQLQCTTPAYRSADTLTSMLIQVSYQPITTESGIFEQYTLSRLKVSSLSSPHGIGVSKGRLEGFVISAFRVQNASMSGFPGALTLTLLRAYSYLYLLFCPPLIYSHNVAIVILLKPPLTGSSTTHKIC